MFVCILTASTHTTLNGITMLATVVPYRRYLLDVGRQIVDFVLLRWGGDVTEAQGATSMSVVAWRKEARI